MSVFVVVYTQRAVKLAENVSDYLVYNNVTWQDIFNYFFSNCEVCGRYGEMMS